MKFGKEDLERQLGWLNDELKKRGITGELCIVRGAAMALAFGSRRSTRDIDALVLSPSDIRAAAAQVATEHGLSPSWLNDGAKGFASATPVEAREVLHLSHLRVISPSAEYILAMKCIAARAGLDEHDADDAKILIKNLGLRSSEDVLDVVARYYDAKRISAKTEYFVRELCDELFPKT